VGQSAPLSPKYKTSKHEFFLGNKLYKQTFVLEINTCVNCPYGITKRAKTLKKPLPPTRALLSPVGISGVRAVSPLVTKNQEF
jgi:hypothetical protein